MPLHAQLQGRVEFQTRAFPQHALRPTADRFTGSIAVDAEYYWDFAGGRQRIIIHPFLRVDGSDSRRTHFDLREALWERVGRDIELRVGLATVFWGVTESQHLVDVINQTDLVENPDGEDKLGQPMVNVSFIRDWGIVDVFIMPFFRERTYPGRGGRLRPQLVVDTDNAQYESGAGRHQLDLALRWSHTLGEWDVGVSVFRGTNRDPLLVPQATAEGLPLLTPYYQIVSQVGLDLQRTHGGWLWKLEAISRGGETLDRYLAFAGGFEYTFVGVVGSAIDLGLLSEYLYDSRGRTQAAFNDDVFVGSRLAFNDVQSTDLLVGAIVDRRTGATLFSIEANRRMTDNWFLSVEGRAFATGQRDVLAGFRRDSYLQIDLQRYF